MPDDDVVEEGKELGAVLGPPCPIEDLWTGRQGQLFRPTSSLAVWQSGSLEGVALVSTLDRDTSLTLCSV